MNESQEVYVPVSTIGYSFDSSLKTEDGSKIDRVYQVPFYQKYTIEELRYYDYLSEGYISIVKPNKHHSNQENQFQRSSINSFNNANQFKQSNVVYHNVSPWSLGFLNASKIEPSPQMEHSQPYGAFPDTNLQFQDDFEQTNIPENYQIPTNHEFLSAPSIFKHHEDDDDADFFM